MPLVVEETLAADRPVEPGASTGSRLTRVLGIAALAGLGTLLVFAFFLTEADAVQQDTVRLLYVHVPSVFGAYIGFTITAIGSAVVLWRGSTWWDLAASAAAEIGVLYCGITLATGIIWGRPTWNTWWEWGDVRLMTTLMLFLVYVGYLAYRRSVPSADVRARRSAVIGLVGVLNIVIVNRSVEWWANRTLHQQSSLTDGKMEDLTLFTLMMGIAVFGIVFVWMLIHRFRLGWLEHQVETVGLEAALAERRAQIESHVDDAVDHPGLADDEEQS